MAKLELNVAESAVVTSPPPATVLEKPAKPVFKQRSPSGWDIVAGKEPNTIKATSDRGDKFEGTIKSFNEALRAE